jgi:succinyl-diaminopimelate desuccinylase
MKSAIAAFVAAVARYRGAHGEPPGSIALLITGDEEGPAEDGTKKLLAAVTEQGERFDHCLVGEPTNPSALGETIKAGRRGSLNGVITVTGRQGHVAYPEKAENPIPPLMDLLSRLTARTLDEGAPHFQHSNLEITSIDVDNPAHNVIPGRARAKFNIRFNTRHAGADLKRWIADEAAAVRSHFMGEIDLDLRVTGEAFLTRPGPFTDLLKEAVAAETGREPALTTGGGTSDARFIKDYAPVAEFGLVGATMHQVDERVAVADIEALTRVYQRVLERYFEVFAG